MRGGYESPEKSSWKKRAISRNTRPGRPGSQRSATATDRQRHGTLHEVGLIEEAGRCRRGSSRMTPAQKLQRPPHPQNPAERFGRNPNRPMECSAQCGHRNAERSRQSRNRDSAVVPRDGRCRGDCQPIGSSRSHSRRQRLSENHRPRLQRPLLGEPLANLVPEVPCQAGQVHAVPEQRKRLPEQALRGSQAQADSYHVDISRRLDRHCTPDLTDQHRCRLTSLAIVPVLQDRIRQVEDQLE